MLFSRPCVGEMQHQIQNQKCIKQRCVALFITFDALETSQDQTEKKHW